MKNQPLLKQFRFRIRSRYFPAVLLATAVSLAGADFTPNPADEAAARKVIDDFAGAWNRHDAKAMAELHSEDVNFINIFGFWGKSRNGLQVGLARSHAGAFAQSTMKVRTEQIRFLAPNIAVVHGTMELLNAPPDTLGECHSIRVLVKEGGKWLISSFQNTLIRPLPPALR
jgi:uncharacterized protein (TIGR02246 family)